ncbi:hypothetical protein ACQEU3_47245 [Spirillospora sp. CA-253888]
MNERNNPPPLEGLPEGHPLSGLVDAYGPEVVVFADCPRPVCGTQVETSLSPEEARVLAAFLVRLADAAEDAGAGR